MGSESKKYLIVSYVLIILIIQGFAIETGIATVSTDRNVIIGFRHPVGSSEDDIIQSHGGLAKTNFRLIPAIAATIPENRLEELRSDPNVLYVENDTVFKIADIYTDEYNNSWGVQHIGSKPVVDRGINGSEVKVAVLDTGIDYTHIDLKDNYRGGYNFVNNDSDPWDDNCLTQYHTCHGTHVSGIITAEKNGIGVIGVAPNVSLYAVKVLGADGSGLSSSIISGLQWAVDNKMDIVSMSFAGPDDTAIHTAVDNAYSSGLLLIAAAGNTYGGPVMYPAGYDSVIAVTGTDSSDLNAVFSPNDSKVELAAPGVNINSTIGMQYGEYGIRSGTSMAAPHVTGVAALIYSNAIKNNILVRSIIDNSAKDLGTPGRDSIYGYGLVDAQNATFGIPTIWPLAFTPPDPINLQNNISQFWVNYTWNPGIGNITDSYNINANEIWHNGTTSTFENITTTPGGWANITVWAFNSSGKGTLSSGDLGKSIQVSIELALVRTIGPPINDSSEVNLSQGNYTIKINNINLSELDMNVYDNGTIRKDLSRKFIFNNTKVSYTVSNVYDEQKIASVPENISINLNIQKLLNVVFIPYGSNGTMCDLRIRRI